MNSKAFLKFDRAAEGLYMATSRSWQRFKLNLRFHPFRSLFLGAFLLGSMWYYEVQYVHGNRVASVAHNLEFEMDTSGDPSTVRRVKAQKVFSAKELAEMNEKVLAKEKVSKQKQQEQQSNNQNNGNNRADSTSSLSSSSSSSSSSTRADVPNSSQQYIEQHIGQPPEVPQTLFVTSGHLQQKEGTWQVRNQERNWSIMAQDQFKQKDDYHYRMERSRDSDYGRHDGK